MRFAPPALVLFVLLAGLARAQTPAGRFTAEEKSQGFSHRTLLAQPREPAAAAQLEAAERAEGVRLRRTLGAAGRLRVLEPAAGETVPQAVARLRATGRYAFVEPDYLVRAAALPNDPHFASGEQWALRNTGQNGGKAGADIGAVAAWDVQTDARSVVVAVIDSGLRVTHEDIAPNLWVNPTETAGNGADDDGNGYADDIHGINANAQRGSTASGTPQDLDGHGTAVASVIAAAGDNGRGIAGVAWSARLMALRFIDASGFGTISDEIECMEYAIAKGARVINASYGGAAFSQASFDTYKRARDAGIIVVCAAGNEGENSDIAPLYPASFLLDNIVSVANSTRTDALAGSSNFGTGAVDLAAPGSSIAAASGFSNTGYITISGTSFSAPMVTGAVALLRARFPADNHRAIINRLLRSVDAVPAFAGKTATGGRLNVNTALRGTSVRPFNDDFATRALLAGERVSTRSSPDHATREAGEPAHAGAASGNGSLWWTWTPTRTGPVAVDTRGSGFDTLLHVYTGAAVGALVSVASNDNDGALTTSKVTFNATAGTAYQIAVDAKGSAAGLLLLAIEQNPNSDAFDSGQLVAGRSWSVNADNRNATRETGEPRIRNNAGGKSVWFRWVAPATRRYRLATYSETVDTMIGVYTGSALNALTEVAASLNDGDSNATVPDGGVTLSATAGTTYHIAVDSEAPASGPAVGGAFKLSCTDSEWEFFGDGPIVTPAVAPNGNLHFIDDYGWIYAVDPDGSRKWRYEMVNYGTFSSPAVAPDGTVYGCDQSRYVYALTPDGVRKWRVQLGGVAQASPAIGADGNIYIRADNGRLYALDRTNGATRWSTDLGVLGAATSYTSPSLAPDGTIYAASAANRLAALTPDGAVKWTFATDAIFGSPAIAADGTIYIGCAAPTRRMYALRPDGTVRWDFVAGDTVSSSAVIGPDGTIYFGCADKKLYALNPAGDLRWALDTGGEIRNSSPIVASDASIFVGSLDGKVHHVNPEGTLRRTYSTAGEVRLSPLLHNGRLYIPSYDERLYAVNVGLAPASTAWPMHRQNVFRSARPQHAALAFGVQPASQTVALEERVTFVAGAVGTPPLAYQWSFNGAAIPGATAATYRLDSVYHSHGGRYTVRVTDPTGAITSNAAVLTLSTPLVLPAVLTAPLAQTVVVGTGVTLTVAANGSPPFTYQWSRDGAPIAGATSSTLTLADPRVADSGQYAVTISNFGGSVTSAPVVVTINPVSRISNLSIRSQVGGAAGTLTVGLTVGGAGAAGAKPLLLRAVGPALGAFGLADFLADPRLALLSGQDVVAQNDDWAGASAVAATSAAVGAFALAPAASKDAALVHSPAAGGYTVRIVGAADAGGVALAEVYDATPADTFVVSTPRLTNVSALTRAGTGAEVLIAGFSIAGATPKTVLVRAIGPALAAFGVGGALADPRLELHANGAAAPLATNDNWGASANAPQIAAASVAVGAFALDAASRDAVLLLTLPPGSYTAQVSGVGATTGVALVEVYDVP